MTLSGQRKFERQRRESAAQRANMAKLLASDGSRMGGASLHHTYGGYGFARIGIMTGEKVPRDASVHR